MPGKQARIKNRLKWRSKRNSEKMAKKATYAAKIASGKNEKRKTSSGGGINKMRPRNHPFGRCGNIGCKRCFPMYAKGALGF